MESKNVPSRERWLDELHGESGGKDCIGRYATYETKSSVATEATLKRTMLLDVRLLGRNTYVSFDN